jgi:predicted DNA-binding protein
MSKIKIDANLYERVKKVAEKAGYATPEEFVIHMIEKELSVLESADSDADVTERLRGLGYIE